MSYRKISVAEEEYGTLKVTHGKGTTSGLRSVRVENCFACNHLTLTGYDEDGTPRVTIPLEFDPGVPAGTEVRKLDIIGGPWE
jgi:hypothetical protein